MATAKKPAKKAEGEWTHEVISEWKQSKTVVWRAQKSETPDGKTLMGIRKFIVKANGDEVVTRDGISFVSDPQTLTEGVEGIIELLGDLIKANGGKKTAAKKPAKKARAEEPEDDEDEEDTAYVLFKKSTNRYLRDIEDGTIKVTPDLGRAKVFESEEEVNDYLFNEGGDAPTLKSFKPLKRSQAKG